MATKDWKKQGSNQWFKRSYPLKKRFKTGTPVVVTIYKTKFLRDKGWFVAVDKSNIGTSLYSVNSPFKTREIALKHAKAYMKTH